MTERTTRVGTPTLTLAKFEWTKNVQQMFISLAAGTVAVSVALTQPQPWMFTDPLLVFVSVAFAFTRVWKSYREEAETAPIWDKADAVPRTGASRSHAFDAIFEIPYVFAVVFLPGSVISLQTFAACLLLFYVSDNYYNFALARVLLEPSATANQGSDQEAIVWTPARSLRNVVGGRPAIIGRALALLPEAMWFQNAAALVGAVVLTACGVIRPQPARIDRAVLQRFFARRGLYDSVAIWISAVLLGLSILVPAVAPGWRDTAIVVAVLLVLVLLALEFFIEPFRGLGIHFGADGSDDDATTDPATPEAEFSSSSMRLWAVPRGLILSAAALSEMRALSEQLRTEGASRLSVDEMINLTGRSDRQLVVITAENLSDGNQVTVGLAYLESSRERDRGYVRSLRVLRGGGSGSTIGALRGLIADYVRDRWPWLPAFEDAA